MFGEAGLGARNARDIDYLAYAWNELDKATNVTDIGRNNGIAPPAGTKDHACIGDVSCVRTAEQFADGASIQGAQRFDVRCIQGHGDSRVSGPAPNLGDDGSRHSHLHSVVQRRKPKRPSAAFIVVEGDEEARINRQASQARPAAATSSGLIRPCSAS